MMRFIVFVFSVFTIASAAAQEAAPDTVAPSLWAHTAEFERDLIEVTEGVWVATGYGLANSILVEGDDGVIIIDAMESREEAARVWADFSQLTDKPIVALIYTHNHADHTFGGRGFVPEGDIPVYAHVSTNTYLDRVINIVRPIISQRSTRMFGTRLPVGPEGFVNDGIGPFLGVGGDNESTIGIIRPNIVFQDRLEVEIAGVQFVMEHAPGETNDQILIWLPERGVLFPGDNVYRAFPNLYTIRGTPYRDVIRWTQSIDRMRELRPEFMVPSHTRPLTGADEIHETLTSYRDAIQYVHDQTIRHMNLGATPDEIVERVHLPEHLATHPFLLEHYGTVEWSVRSIFTGYLGWFGGDAAFLSPTPPLERAQGIIDLAGGVGPATAAAETALAATRLEWAAELSTYILAIDSENARAIAVKAMALRQMGYRSTSPAGRNYYLTQALELEGAVSVVEDEAASANSTNVVEAFPIRSILVSLPVRLNPARALGKDIVVGFRFSDTGETFTMHVRNGIADLQDGFPEDPDVAIETSTAHWFEIMTRQRSLPLAIATFDLRVTTGVLTVPLLIEFLTLFGGND